MWINSHLSISSVYNYQYDAIFSMCRLIDLGITEMVNLCIEELRYLIIFSDLAFKLPYSLLEG